jgi:hypothetical protein
LEAPNALVVLQFFEARQAALIAKDDRQDLYRRAALDAKYLPVAWAVQVVRLRDYSRGAVRSERDQS